MMKEVKFINYDKYATYLSVEDLKGLDHVFSLDDKEGAIFADTDEAIGNFITEAFKLMVEADNVMPLILYADEREYFTVYLETGENYMCTNHCSIAWCKSYRQINIQMYNEDTGLGQKLMNLWPGSKTISLSIYDPKFRKTYLEDYGQEAYCKMFCYKIGEEMGPIE